MMENGTLITKDYESRRWKCKPQNYLL